MTDQLQPVIDAITAQTAMMIRGPLLRIANVFENNQDDDGDGCWDNPAITESIYAILAEHGMIVRCPECGFDYSWVHDRQSTNDEELAGSCPQWDSHSCGGGCGYSNDECECADSETCDDCGEVECVCD